MSPNLQLVLGLAPPEGSAVTKGGVEAGGDDWRPPAFAGLTNSKPLTTLQPLVVGQNKGLQVEYRKRASDDKQGGDNGDGWSDEEGWDYEGERNLVCDC